MCAENSRRNEAVKEVQGRVQTTPSLGLSVESGRRPICGANGAMRTKVTVFMTPGEMDYYFCALMKMLSLVQSRISAGLSVYERIDFG